MRHALVIVQLCLDSRSLQCIFHDVRIIAKRVEFTCSEVHRRVVGVIVGSQNGKGVGVFGVGVDMTGEKSAACSHFLSYRESNGEDSRIKCLHALLVNDGSTFCVLGVGVVLRLVLLWNVIPVRGARNLGSNSLERRLIFGILHDLVGDLKGKGATGGAAHGKHFGCITPKGRCVVVSLYFAVLVACFAPERADVVGITHL